MKIGLDRWLAAAALLLAGATAVQAREPGIAPQFPPGQTLGLANAVSPPPGLYLMNRLAWYDATLRDNNGDYNGQDVTVKSEALQLTWVPGWTLLGASYKAFVNVPFVDMDVKRTTRATGRVGSYHTSGMADPKIQPLDLSWTLGDGFYAGAGLGVYLPVGTYSKGANINIGQHFWTVEPSVAFSYFKDGWNASLHALYDTNTENDENHYKSGDQVFLNGTLTYNLAGWDLGPVGYYQKQVGHDSNEGGATTFRGRTFAATEQVAAGALVSRMLGPVRATLFYTHDVEAKNTLAGDKFWFNLSLPIP
ncbi:MAG: transporter [Solirubrobacterales bacterium]